jgi:zinc transport system permease protein
MRSADMLLFFKALANPDIAFLRYALIAGVMGSVAFGMVGSYVVARRISSIAGAVAHSTLGGIGLGLYLQEQAGVAWFGPIPGALLFALLAGLVIGLVTLYGRQREDTVIGAIWAVGMATGLLLLSRTPGYVEPMSYLFGNILLISRQDLFIIMGLDLGIIALSLVFFNKFLAVCFDEEFARTRGVRAWFFYILLLCMIALTVVIMVRIVGIVMVIALLTLPAAVAGLLSRELKGMMLWASGVCLVFTVLGMGLAYSYDLPASSTIILVAGAVYLLSITGGGLLRGLRR